MRSPRLIWRLFFSYFFIIIITLLPISWYSSQSMRTFYKNQTASKLETRAKLILWRVRNILTDSDSENLDLLCQEIGEEISTRVTVILPSGKVIGDSERPSDQMDNHGNRPEVKEALAGKTGQNTGYSHTLNKEMMYVAIPVRADGRVLGVLRTSLALGSINEAIGAVTERVAFGGLIAAIIAAGVSLVLSRRISRPLERLRRGVEKFAQGDLVHRLPVSETPETKELAETMNQMATQLDERIATVVRQRNELEAVLSGMMEGVIAVDVQQHVISMNRAAADLLEVDVSQSLGRNIQEVVRNPELQRFIWRTLASNRSVEDEVVLHGDRDIYLQMHGALLEDSNGATVGGVVVLNDVTRIRHVEKVRRDFVANVSHELKTPITSIKGFVETLLDGAVNNPQDADRFLKIIAKHADRLNSIIEDLLTLSRIEQEAKREALEVSDIRIKNILQSAIEVCEARGREKGIVLDLECGENIRADINEHLVEQAVINLIDNAIKYSDTDSKIHIRAVQTDSEAVLLVQDEGCGIAQEDVPRLFERFYRVDKARSRKLGGTGLGLAIVKHIAQVHGGQVTVESSVGKGSIFSIHLPK